MKLSQIALVALIFWCAAWVFIFFGSVAVNTSVVYALGLSFGVPILLLALILLRLIAERLKGDPYENFEE